MSLIAYQNLYTRQRTTLANRLNYVVMHDGECLWTHEAMTKGYFNGVIDTTPDDTLVTLGATHVTDIVSCRELKFCVAICHTDGRCHDMTNMPFLTFSDRLSCLSAFYSKVSKASMADPFTDHRETFSVKTMAYTEGNIDTGIRIVFDNLIDNVKIGYMEIPDLLEMYGNIRLTFLRCQINNINQAIGGM